MTKREIIEKYRDETIDTIEGAFEQEFKGKYLKKVLLEENEATFEKLLKEIE